MQAEGQVITIIYNFRFISYSQIGRRISHHVHTIQGQVKVTIYSQVHIRQPEGQVNVTVYRPILGNRRSSEALNIKGQVKTTVYKLGPQQSRSRSGQNHYKLKPQQLRSGQGHNIQGQGQVKVTHTRNNKHNTKLCYTLCLHQTHVGVKYYLSSVIITLVLGFVSSVRLKKNDKKKTIALSGKATNIHFFFFFVGGGSDI